METSKCYWSGLPHLPGEPVAKHFPAHCQSRDSLLLLPTVPSLMIFNCMSDHLSSRLQNSSSSMAMPVFHFLAQSPQERQAQIFTVEPWLLLGCPSCSFSVNQSWILSLPPPTIFSPSFPLLLSSPYSSWKQGLWSQTDWLFLRPHHSLYSVSPQVFPKLCLPQFCHLASGGNCIYHINKWANNLRAPGIKCGIQ